MKKSEFLKLEELEPVEQLEAILEAPESQNLPPPVRQQLERAVKAFRDPVGLAAEIGTAGALVGTAAAGPALAGAAGGAAAAAGVGSTGVGITKTLVTMATISPVLGITRSKIGELWNQLIPDNDFKLQFLSDYYKTETPGDTIEFEGKIYDTGEVALKELKEALGKKGIEPVQQAIYLDNLEEARAANKSALEFFKQKRGEMPEFEVRPGERDLPAAKRFIAEFERKQERTRGREESEAAALLKEQQKAREAAIAAEQAFRQTPGGPQLAGTPAQQTEESLRIRREAEAARQAQATPAVPTSLPPTPRPIQPIAEEAPTKIDFQIESQKGGKAADVRLAEAEERRREQEEASRRKTLIFKNTRARRMAAAGL